MLIVGRLQATLAVAGGRGRLRAEMNVTRNHGGNKSKIIIS